MDRSGYQASGECVSEGRGMSVGAIVRAGRLFEDSFQTQMTPVWLQVVAAACGV